MNKKENKKPTVQYFFVTSDERKNYSRKYKFEKTTLFPVFNLCLFLYRMYIENDVIYVQKTESQE